MTDQKCTSCGSTENASSKGVIRKGCFLVEGKKLCIKCADAAILNRPRRFLFWYLRDETFGKIANRVWILSALANLSVFALAFKLGGGMFALLFVIGMLWFVCLNLNWPLYRERTISEQTEFTAWIMEDTLGM